MTQHPSEGELEARRIVELEEEAILAQAYTEYVELGNRAPWVERALAKDYIALKLQAEVDIKEAARVGYQQGLDYSPSTARLREVESLRGQAELDKRRIVELEHALDGADNRCEAMLFDKEQAEKRVNEEVEKNANYEMRAVKAEKRVKELEEENIRLHLNKTVQTKRAENAESLLAEKEKLIVSDEKYMDSCEGKISRLKQTVGEQAATIAGLEAQIAAMGKMIGPDWAKEHDAVEAVVEAAKRVYAWRGYQPPELEAALARLAALRGGHGS